MRVRLSEILQAWEREIKHPLERKPVRFCFLDEAQLLDFWETDVKLFYDKKYPLQFVVSGSSATLIRKTTESLAGRTFEEILLPFDFEEFLLVEGPKVGLAKETIRKLKRGEKNPIPFKNKLFLLWDKYLEQGGFPHLFKFRKEEHKQALQQDIVDKVIYRDLVELYSLKEPVTLERVFRYLTETSSGILNLSDLSSNIKMSWETTQKYLTYLKQAYLVFTLAKYSRSPKEVIRSLEKAYVVDTAIMGIFSLPKRSALWETAVARHFWEVGQRSCYFWRNLYEVDIVLEGKSGLIPIEVKTGERIDKKDLRGLVTFMKKFKTKKGTVIYAGEKKVEKIENLGKICFYPVYELALGLVEEIVR